MASKGRAGGVLPINAAATKKEKAKPSPRSQAPRLRLIIRRLPPGLTEAEFWSALGEEWLVGKGKVDWAAFKEGKVSKDPAKPSRPARGYLRVKEQSLLDELSSKVKQTPFQDAKNTTRDPCLIGPPSLEFAPFNKVASGRVRNDGRQGTIDQDQEFIDFLQSLTEPIVKATNGTENDATKEKVTTTPLVQYLKEKKANKAKEAAEKKSSKARQQEKKEPKESKEKVVVKSPEKAKVAKAGQEAVKAINKSVAQLQSKTPATPAKSESKAAAAKDTTAPTTTPAKRERANISAAARIQRDLGLAPKSPRASRAASAATTAASAVPLVKPEPTEAGKTAPVAAESKAVPAATKATPPTEPRATRGNAGATAATTPTAPPAAATAKPSPAPRGKVVPQPSPGSKSAFLKHANPSQGVTEELLRATFAAFGTMTRCEIDKKKGLGYVDFEEPESLKKAMAASPIKVGDKGGQVVVMENRNAIKAAKAGTPALKAPPTGPAAVKANTPVASPKPASAAPVPATASPALSATPTTSSPGKANTSETAISTPPTAPRAATPRGGAASARGGRGNFAQGGRGGVVGAAAGGRGGPRGRGYGRGGRGGAAAGTLPATNAPASATATAGGGAAPTSSESK